MFINRLDNYYKDLINIHKIGRYYFLISIVFYFLSNHELNIQEMNYSYCSY